MSNGRKLPKSIFENLKSRLLAKTRGYKRAGKSFGGRRSLYAGGRAVGNSETVDEAYLEDTF